MGFSVTSNGTAVNSLSVAGGWSIMDDSGITESSPETGPVATVRFKVHDSNQRYKFVQQLLGSWKGTPPATISYTGPYEYPPSTNLVCTSVPSIEGLGRKIPMLGVGLPWWTGTSSIVTAVFSRPPWQASSNRGYFSISFAGGGENIHVPQTTFLFADGTPNNTPLGRMVAHAQITVTRYRMPFIPDAYAMQVINTINDAPFGIGWNTYNTGTLFFAGINSEIECDPLGNITYTVAYLFSFRSIPWNNFLHPNRTTGFAPVTDGNGAPMYPSASFDILP